MLVLSRKVGEIVYMDLDVPCIEQLLALAKVGGPVRFEVILTDLDRGKVRLGFIAPRNVRINRKELVNPERKVSRGESDGDANLFPR